MKILHIIPSLITGGAERLALDICVELNKRDDALVKLIILNNINTFKEYSFVTYIPASISLSILKKNSSHIEKLQESIDAFKPDIIHSHLFEAEIISRSCYYPKAKWFSHFHDNIPQLRNFGLSTLLNKVSFTTYYEKRYLLNRYKKNGSTQFIAISNDTKSYATKVLPKKYTAHYLKNAIDFNKFNNTNSFKHTKKLKLINIGSFQAKKNQQFLIDIIYLLKKKNIDFQLTLLGEGKFKLAVEKKIIKLSLEKEVSLMGNVTNVQDFLSEADIYLHSAYYEPFGLVLLEAMAAGLPVITLDGKGNRDIIEEGKNGYMIYEQDAEKFAARIIQLWNDKQKMLEISSYAQQYAKKYDIVNYVDKLLGLYQNAIDLK